MNRKAGMVLLLGVASILPAGVAAQNIFQKAANTISSWFSTGDKKDEATATEHIDITKLTLDENLSIPELDNKEARKIRAAQSREMKRLRKARLTDLKLVRNYEVIKATLAASNLFLPNDTMLSDKADIFLRPFLSDLRIPDYYHVMVVMHSDDTGSESYCLDLTRPGRRPCAAGLPVMAATPTAWCCTRPVPLLPLPRTLRWRGGPGIVASTSI